MIQFITFRFINNIFSNLLSLKFINVILTTYGLILKRRIITQGITLLEKLMLKCQPSPSFPTTS